MVDRIEHWQITKPLTRSRSGLVASQSRIAAEVGAELLAEGGNAVDAALATAFALTVAEPWMSGIGGIGSMIVHLAAEKRTYAVDYGPIAARGLNPARYKLTGKAGPPDLFGWPGVIDDRNVHGYESIAVPGSVAGFGLVHGRFGKLPWRKVLAPAIRLARKGLRVDWWTTLNIAAEAADLRNDPVARKTYLPNDLPPVTTSTVTPPYLDLGPLAATLERIAQAGWQDYYTGDLARTIAADLQAGGSAIRAEDLAAYAARLVEPTTVERNGVVLATMSGLFAGPTFKAAFAGIPPRIGTKPGPRAFAAYAAALSRAYADRLERMGQEDGKGKGSTTHLAAVDAEGNMVSLTNTLLSRFGSRSVLPRTGILMNNGMMWFDPRPGRPNSIGPGKRPLTNMCPVIATRDGKGWFAIGGSGGRKILPAILQICSFLADFGMSLEDAFHQPRIDVSAPDKATADWRLGTRTIAAVAKVVPTTEVEAAAYPGNFANPIAVLRQGRWNEGMTNVTLPSASVAVG
jgi:gamma-glutamyltranspeptidase / glutathione hydrolase